jgi:hypothetical protein
MMIWCVYVSPQAFFTSWTRIEPGLPGKLITSSHPKAKIEKCLLISTPAANHCLEWPTSLKSHSAQGTPRMPTILQCFNRRWKRNGFQCLTDQTLAIRSAWVSNWTRMPTLRGKNSPQGTHCKELQLTSEYRLLKQPDTVSDRLIKPFGGLPVGNELGFGITRVFERSRYCWGEILVFKKYPRQPGPSLKAFSRDNYAPVNLQRLLSAAGNQTVRPILYKDGDW